MVGGCNRFFIVKIIAPFGAPALAAFRVAESLNGLLQMAGSQNIAMACSVITGQNFGAGKPENVKKTLLMSNRIYLFIAIPGMILFNLFPQFFISLFIKDTAVVAPAAVYLHFLTISLMFSGFIGTGNGVLNVGGRAGMVMVVSLIGNYLVQIPAAYLLSRYTPLGLTGVWIADPMTYIVQSALVFFFLNRLFFSGNPIRLRPDILRIPFYDAEEP
jgi:Na+-driven multidrug efflux pump